MFHYGTRNREQDRKSSYIMVVTTLDMAEQGGLASLVLQLITQLSI